MSTSVKANVKKLKDFYLAKAPRCVHKPAGLLKYDFVTPSYDVKAGADDSADVAERSLTGHYLQMYDWDACFFSQVAPKAGIDGLARSVVANFLSLSEKDGHVPRTVSPSRIWDNGDMCKPFLAQTLLGSIKSQNDRGEAKKSIDGFLANLDCYLSYYVEHRRDKSGLYHWRNVLESGVDDNFALLFPLEAAKGENESVTNFPDGRLLAVDLSSYLAVEFQSMVDLCEIAGNTDIADKYKTLAVSVKSALDEKLWDEKLKMYVNFDPATGEHNRFRAWTGLLPALLGITSKERTMTVLEENVMNEDHFLRHAGLSSVAVSEPLYNQSKRGLYGRVICSNWQGPMWILPNGIAIRALLREGMKKEAEELATRVVRTLSEGLESTGTLYENYNADTGTPLFAPQFMSWNILALEMIEILE